MTLREKLRPASSPSAPSRAESSQRKLDERRQRALNAVLPGSGRGRRRVGVHTRSSRFAIIIRIAEASAHVSGRRMPQGRRENRRRLRKSANRLWPRRRWPSN